MKDNLTTVYNTRQYMLSKDFEIFYYNDLGIRNADVHTHDYYEFYFFLEGDAQLYLDGTSYGLTYGSFAVIPPGTPHCIKVIKYGRPYRRFVFWISKDYCDSLAAVSEDYMFLIRMAEKGHFIRHFEEDTFHTIQGKVFQLIEEIQADRFGKLPRITLYVNDLVLHLNRVVHDELCPEPGNLSGQNLYGKIVQYIESHIDEDLSLDTLAQKFYVSKYHISHIFSESMGLPVQQYIRKKRLALCRDAIISGTEISDACAAYGFSDYSVFYRAFVKEYGKSPKKYRDELLRDINWEHHLPVSSK